MRLRGLLAVGAVLGALVAATSSYAATGINKIQHVIVVMQENRSFDNYFGTYPGAAGIPSGTCVPNPRRGGCDKPYFNEKDKAEGGPHGHQSAIEDVNGGKMDGFIKAFDAKLGTLTRSKREECEKGLPTCTDVMSYNDARGIPNYWKYAEEFALQDHMFASSLSWSLPEHMYLVSGWAGICPSGAVEPFKCVESLDQPVEPPTASTKFDWTDLTYLMFKHKVSWGYFIQEGQQPDCENDEALSCKKVRQTATTPGIWNPLPYFSDVKEDGQLGNIQPLPHFYADTAAGPTCNLPAVSWVIPNNKVSEHSPSKISVGQTYVTTLINNVMRSPCWSSSAIFLSWDDWGGYYDHVAPPIIDGQGYGLRVPGLVISPYAKKGFIDKRQLSHDAYLRFIEDDFLGGARLNPATDGRPDPRKSVREEVSGTLEEDFNFSQTPRPPVFLPAHPEPGPPSIPPG